MSLISEARKLYPAVPSTTENLAYIQRLALSFTYARAVSHYVLAKQR